MNFPAVLSKTSYKGVANDPDRVWSRLSRGLSKSLFVLAYLLFTVAGTTALASVGILVGAAIK